jgi:hypothetical protein
VSKAESNELQKLKKKKKKIVWHKHAILFPFIVCQLFSQASQFCVRVGDDRFPVGHKAPGHLPTIGGGE